jgi:hypothetical protein
MKEGSSELLTSPGWFDDGVIDHTGSEEKVDRSLGRPIWEFLPFHIGHWNTLNGSPMLVSSLHSSWYVSPSPQETRLWVWPERADLSKSIKPTIYSACFAVPFLLGFSCRIIVVHKFSFTRHDQHRRRTQWPITSLQKTHFLQLQDRSSCVPLSFVEVCHTMRRGFVSIRAFSCRFARWRFRYVQKANKWHEDSFLMSPIAWTRLPLEA